MIKFRKILGEQKQAKREKQDRLTTKVTKMTNTVWILEVRSETGKWL